MTNLDSSQGRKDGSTHTNQCETPDQQRKDKSHENLKRCEKTFDVIQHPFMIKGLKVDIEETYFNIIKAIYDKLTTNIILNGKKLKDFPLKIWNKTRMPILTTSVPHNIGSTSHSNQTRKRNKRYSN